MAVASSGVKTGVLEFLAEQQNRPLSLPKRVSTSPELVYDEGSERSIGYQFSLLVQSYHIWLNCPVKYIDAASLAEQARARRLVEEQSIFGDSTRLFVLDGGSAAWWKTFVSPEGTYVLMEMSRADTKEAYLRPEPYRNAVPRNNHIKILSDILDLPFSVASLTKLDWSGATHYAEIEAILRTAKAAGWTLDQLRAQCNGQERAKFLSSIGSGDCRGLFEMIQRIGARSALRLYVENILRASQYAEMKSRGLQPAVIADSMGISMWRLGEIANDVRGLSVRDVDELRRRLVACTSKWMSDTGGMYNDELALDWLLLTSGKAGI